VRWSVRWVSIEGMGLMLADHMISVAAVRPLSRDVPSLGLSVRVLGVGALIGLTLFVQN
jgi:hypothetical protein